MMRRFQLGPPLLEAPLELNGLTHKRWTRRATFDVIGIAYLVAFRAVGSVVKVIYIIYPDEVPQKRPCAAELLKLRYF